MRVLPILVAVCFTIDASSAAEITAVNSKDGKTRVDLVGEILPGDADKLKTEIQKANDVNRLVVTIRLNSQGGNLVEGVTIADIVRKGRIATSVLTGAQCASACFIIFAAGSEKFASYQAQIGVHGASDENGRETTQSNSATIGMARVIKELGVPSSIVGKMVVTPPNQMVWLTVDDLRSMETKMFGKPTQTATEPYSGSQLPKDITPGTQATAPASHTPTWAEVIDRVIAVSSSQNNGKPQVFRTCQPEFKTCLRAIYYKNKLGKDAFVKITEDISGNIIVRELCSLNDDKDIRECVVWDTGVIRHDMKNSKGEWYEVDRK